MNNKDEGVKDLNIKIYISCHKESYVPENRLFYPIQVGTSLAPKKFNEMLHDDDGENISYKNRYYCELTAQYWAWKNDDADYYGFFHYRRYLSFNPIEQTEDGWGSILYDGISDQALSQMNIEEKYMEKFIQQYDVITTTPRKLKSQINQSTKSNKNNKNKNNKSDKLISNKKETIYDQYASTSVQKKSDLDLVIKIIGEKYPQFNDSVKEYLNSSNAYECNMFIMKKELFKEYCEWLFTILEEHEKRADLSNYSVEQFRVSGFLAERLFGIYYTYLKKQKDIKRCELQKSMFKDTECVKTLDPAFTENSVPVVMSANEEFVPYLTTFIKSVMDNSTTANNYDLVVLHKNISADNIDIITSMVSEYKNFKIRFFNISSFLKDIKLFVDKHLTVETYFRLLIQQILPKYNKVLYLDCDMVVKADVAELYNENMDGYLLGAVKDIDYAGVENCDNERQAYTRNVLKMKSPFNYFQAGVLILNLDEFRNKFTVEELLRVAGSYEWKHHDQDVLNYLCEGSVKFIDQKWNVVMNWKEENKCRMDILKDAPRDIYISYTEARRNPKIIHYAGHQKPWNESGCDFAQHFWSYARKTPYYEMILSSMTNYLMEKNEVEFIETDEKTKISKISRGKKKGDFNAIHIDNIEEPIYIDGLYIKLINKMNKMFPKDSKRRERLKKIIKLFVK